MKKVGIFTTFFETQSGYSLIAVAEIQIRMLLEHGYEPLVIVQNGVEYTDDLGETRHVPFQEQPPPSVWNRQSVDLRPALPFMHLNNGIAEDFEDRVVAIYDVIKSELADCDVCITHDVMLQRHYKEHNVAVRRLAKERPDLLWLHWVHSVPRHGRVADYPGNCRNTPPPGYLIYPNDSERNVVVGTYGLQGQEWRVRVSRAGHTVDPLDAWDVNTLTRTLVTKAGLLSGDIVAIYPARLDRGKQPDKIVRLMVGVKRAGRIPRLLIADWQSAGKRFQTYEDELERLADSYGIGDCINFTSRLDDRCSQGVNRTVIQELFRFANIYVHPSMTETYSLVIHEAMLAGCLAVLNHDLGPMRELFGATPIYMDFGSDQVPRANYEPNEQAFWDGEALRMLAELDQCRGLKGKMQAIREWTPSAMWKDFAPLLHLQPIGEP